MWGNYIGLTAFDGRVDLVYPGNLNVTGTQLRTQDIHIAVGPRLVTSDSGPILGDAEVVGDFAGVIDYNGPAADGRNQFTGFVIEFDRVIDPSTIDPSQVKVIYRSPTDDPVGAGTIIPVASVEQLDDIVDPLSGRSYGSKRFFVRLASPQAAVGTYSYLIGSKTAAAPSTIKDRVRNLQLSYVPTGEVKTFNYTAAGAGDQIQDYAGGPTPLVTQLIVPGARPALPPARSLATSPSASISRTLTIPICAWN